MELILKEWYLKGLQPVPPPEIYYMKISFLSAAIFSEERKYMAAALGEVAQWSDDGDYDMMLIDNGSKSDGKSKYTTHETGQNTYFGGALNIALDY